MTDDLILRMLIHYCDTKTMSERQGLSLKELGEVQIRAYYIEKELKAWDAIKQKLEIKSNDIGIEDIFIKGTDTIVIYNEDDSFEIVKKVLENECNS